jgi:type IV pilus assembly protein PilC
MPTYLYQAKDTTGQTVSGEVTANDERTAAGRVRELGYYPMQVERGSTVQPAAATQAMPPGYSAQTPHQAQSMAGAQSTVGSTVQPRVGDLFSNGERAFVYGSWFERHCIYPIWTGVAPRDLALFYRQFAAMLSAGMSPARALKTIQDQSSGMLRRAAWYMSRHVESGGKLSEAMSIFPHVFTKLQRSIIMASEETGALDVMMVRLSEYIEADYALRLIVRRETFMTKINFIATFLLPPLVIAVTQGATAYLSQVVMPLLWRLIELFALWALGRYALTVRQIAYVYDAFKAYLPYFGTTVRMLALAKFARAFGSLYSSGVLIPRAVTTAAEVSGNEYLNSMMKRAVDGMTAGDGLTESFARTGVFPPMFLSMMSTGETTGNLDGMLNKVAEFYEGESAVRLHQSVTVLNVLLFLVVAGIVGYIVVRFYAGFYGGIMSAAGG